MAGETRLMWLWPKMLMAAVTVEVASSGAGDVGEGWSRSRCTALIGEQHAGARCVKAVNGLRAVRGNIKMLTFTTKLEWRT